VIEPHQPTSANAGGRTCGYPFVAGVHIDGDGVDTLSEADILTKPDQIKSSRAIPGEFNRRLCDGIIRSPVAVSVAICQFGCAEGAPIISPGIRNR
jgi:hypothetical protein